VSIYKGIAFVGTGAMLLFGILGHGPSTYRYAILFLGPFLWAVYFLRHLLHVHPIHFAVFAAALLFHDLGAFGTYGHFYFGLEFDTYVHFIFGIAGGLLISRALKYSFGLRGWQLWIGTTLLILGIGAIHEMIEAGSTALLGEKGMYKMHDPDKFDTQKDLLNNMLGCLTALFFCALFRRFSQSSKRPE
jgi:uncharacterized membrane protein YjdF